MRLGVVLVLLCAWSMWSSAHAEPWRPGAGATEIMLWPEGLKIEQSRPGRAEDSGLAGRVAGRPWRWVAYVNRPSMIVYPPRGPNTGAAVMVFPGGGYEVLAIDLEGVEVCDWITSRGMTCALVKYRVPDSGPWWEESCNCRRIPKTPMALQDAQRAVSLLRQRAPGLGIDPHRIGVIGFSAGGHVVAGVSNTMARTYARVDTADDVSSVPDFAMPIYPGHLWAREDEDGDARLRDLTLSGDIRVSAKTPPTFIVMAQDDHVDNVRQALSYYTALLAADAPVEMHLYAHGGHAFGLRRTEQPITEWPDLAERWMRSIKVLPAQ